jgi:hypothetical protein
MPAINVILTLRCVAGNDRPARESPGIEDRETSMRNMSPASTCPNILTIGNDDLLDRTISQSSELESESMLHVDTGLFRQGVQFDL